MSDRSEHDDLDTIVDDPALQADDEKLASASGSARLHPMPKADEKPNKLGQQAERPFNKKVGETGQAPDRQEGFAEAPFVETALEETAEQALASPPEPPDVMASPADEAPSSPVTPATTLGEQAKRPIDQNLGEQEKSPIDQNLGEQAKRPIDQNLGEQEKSPIDNKLPDSPVFLPAPPKAKAQPKPRRRGRLKKVLGISALLLVSLLFFAYLSAPFIGAHLLRNELPRIEKELGRRMDFGSLELHGISGLSLHDVVLYDKQGDTVFARCDTLRVDLSHSPLFGMDFQLSSILVDGLQIELRQNPDGSTNYADLQEKFEKIFEKKTPSGKPKKPSPYARYFKPLPPVELRNASISLQSPDFDANAAANTQHRFESLKQIRLQLHQPDLQSRVEFDAHAVATYVVSGQQFSQALSVTGGIKSKSDGTLRLSFDGGLVLPFAEQALGRAVRVGVVQLELPTTVLVEDLWIAGEHGFDDAVLTLDRGRALLTAIPPKKKGGVYVKETELYGLRAKLVIQDDGELAIADIIDKLSGKKTPFQALASRVGNKLESGARAGAGLPPKKVKPKGVRDYFVTQRLYLTDADLLIDDRRPNGVGLLRLDKLDFGFGYRGIRKRVEGELSFDVNGGAGGRFYTSATYSMLYNRIDIVVELEELLLRPIYRHLEANLQALSHADQSSSYADLALALLLSSVKLDDASIDSKLKFRLEFEKQRYRVGGRLALNQLEILAPSLSSMPIDALDLDLDFESTYDHKRESLQLKRFKLGLDEAELQMAFDIQPIVAQLDPSFGLKTSDESAFNLSLSIPPQPAQRLFEALPYAMRPALTGMRLGGEWGFELTAAGALNALSDMQLDTQVQLQDFNVEDWPADCDVSALNTGMSMRVRDPKALHEHRIVIPPSSHPSDDGVSFVPSHDDAQIREHYEHWTLYSDLSPWMVQMITTTEDGSFFSHQGFSTFQLKEALASNVDKGEFKRGASTISMQLVKNVFLGRQKTIARKLQEFFLTWLMESVVKVPKKRILEIYFNVIEFGPEIYGIREAARYYFGKQPADLSLREVAFLVAIIPNPRNGEGHRLRGELSPRLDKLMSWYIREMYRRKCDPERLAKLQRKYEKQGRAAPFQYCCPSPSTLEALQSEPLQFYRPAEFEPPYRPELYDERGQRLDSNAAPSCAFFEETEEAFEEPVLTELPMPE
ncbi:MAG: transglycosylase domain-containing protein [Myxococcota bacterium]|jgi:hypothetical protein|nr:transglycosylase domain-containing protein [Myxococcota bacterium]